jgi:hypothetical protein
MVLNKLKVVLGLSAVLIFSACDSTGQISGQVLDAFTGKPIERASVQIQNTSLRPILTKADGKFDFPAVKMNREIAIRTGKAKHTLSSVPLILTEKEAQVSSDIYLINLKGFRPGLYEGSDSGSVKISNSWLSFEANCASTAAWNRKLKSKSVLNSPLEKAKELNAFFYSSSISATLQAKIAPVEIVRAETLEKCNTLVDPKAKVIAANMSKAVALKTSYATNGLTKIEGELMEGKQALILMHGKKIVSSYLLRRK